MKDFKPPKMGRPPKPKDEAEKKAAKKRVRKEDPIMKAEVKKP